METDNRKHLVDEWLDSALKQRANVEPRPGLENRILASIRAERNRDPKPNWNWRPVWFVVAIAIALFTVLSWRRPAPRTTVAGNPGIIPSQELSPQTTPVSPAIRRIKHTHAHQPPKTPRLEQFPSPQPLTEQEQMLTRYIRQYPREARLVAQAQTELLRQEANPADGPPETTQISDQQN